MEQTAALNSCICAIVKEWLVCHTVTYDLRCPSLDLGLAVLALPNNHGASGCQRRVFVEEIEGSEEKANCVAGCCRVGDVLWVRHMQEAHCHPGNQVLHTGESTLYEVFRVGHITGSFYLLECANRPKCQHLWITTMVLTRADEQIILGKANMNHWRNLLENTLFLKCKPKFLGSYMQHHKGWCPLAN